MMNELRNKRKRAAASCPQTNLRGVFIVNEIGKTTEGCCVNCEFYDGKIENGDLYIEERQKGHYGFCVRHAPKPFTGEKFELPVMAHFPLVRRGQRCGEFKVNENR